MRNAARWWTVAVASVAALVLYGCSKEKKDATPLVREQTESPAPSDTNSSGGPAVAPAETVAEMWPRIETEQNRLAAAIEGGRLKDVGRLAFGIRDMVVVLADRALVETPDIAQRLPPMLELVRESAGRLDELGAAGDLRETQREFAKLTSILAGMKAATTARVP